MRSKRIEGNTESIRVPRMQELHAKSLNKEYITWGDFKRLEQEIKEQAEKEINEEWLSKLLPEQLKVSLDNQRKEFLELIKKDILLFEDARDIFINLKEQGVGTWDIMIERTQYGRKITFTVYRVEKVGELVEGIDTLSRIRAIEELKEYTKKK